ncbi:MAG TPA: hypothetical protein DC054_08130 [Blastocatellia bacterium]|nr:hypothetical protein [Blastocatellia bacterium]
MRIFRIVNVIPQDHSNETNADAEPSVTVNPSNPDEMIVTAFTPEEAGSPNGPLFFSSDGGENWSVKFDIPGGETHDQSPLFAKTSGELYLGTLRGDTGDLDVLHTANPSTTAAVPLETRPPVDQPWVEATTVIGGPDDGKDRVYVGYNRNGIAKSATVDVCLDARAGTPTFTQIQIDKRSPSPSDGYEIRPTAHADGTVYVAFKSRSSFVGSNSITDIVVARDDNWGAGGSPFTALIDPGDGKAGMRVARDVHINEDAPLGGIRLNNDLNVAVDPTNSDVVYIVWCDNEGPNYTLRVRSSLNRGVDWSGDLLVADNAALATMTINSRGRVGLFYQQLVGGLMETHFRSTVDGTNWDDMLLARTATSPDFTGDYGRLVSVGSDFYGVFPAMNSPNPANFFPNGGGTFRYQRNTMGNSLVGLDGVAVIDPSVDPFFFKVQQRDCVVITDRSTFGKDEINAMLHQASPAVISAAFYVAVDGFRASDLGITNATLSGTPNVAPSISFNPGLSPAPAGDFRVVATACTAEDADHLEFPQRFTWVYSFKFFNDSDFTQENLPVTLTASITSTAGLMVTGQALITLTTQPNPYEIDGPTSWLSVDVQVFQIRQGGSLSHTPGIKLTSGPNNFITQMIGNSGGGYNDPALARAPSHPFDLDLVANQDSSSVEWAGALLDISQFPFPQLVPVYNFAIARVRYRALSNPAPNVRVFFRLFQASTTSTAFQGTTYATGGQGGTKIPLLGVVNGEVVTIPCFAAPRVDPTNAQGLNAQTDPANLGPLGQPIPPDGSGAEVQAYFGCWLDINQTTQVLPASPASAAGPFTPVQSIQQAIRTQHQCLVAEINLDLPLPQIPVGQSPATSDKLAQRNLTIVGIASPHLVPHTFDIKPTAAFLPPGETPDELMIDWGNLPEDSEADIYLPGTSADTILSMASREYSIHGLSRVDEHTLRCKTRGITYVPIPPGVGSNFAGLLSINLPESLTRKESFKVITRQITNAVAQVPSVPPVIGIAPAVGGPDVIKWRRVLGSFQISIPIGSKPALLVSEERLLSVLKWVAQAIPLDNRWYPVFQRYLEQIGIRVTSLGGDPTQIVGSPDGNGRRSICGHKIRWLIPLLLAFLLVLLAVAPLIWAAPVATVGLIVVLGIACYWYWRCKPSICDLIGVLIVGLSLASLVLGILALLGYRPLGILLMLAILGVLGGILVIVAALRGCCSKCADSHP